MIDRPVTLAAAGLVISRQHGDPFQESRFAGAVFTDDDGDGPVETQLKIILQEKAGRTDRPRGRRCLMDRAGRA
jgi:hypothetical protein